MSITTPTELSRSFAAFDLETTSKHPQHARIVEWAVVVFDVETITSHHSRVDPGVPLPIEASRIHSITEADLIAAPTSAQSLPKLLNLLAQQSLVITYNGDEYDLKVLAAECQRHGLTMPSLRHLDIYPIAAATSRLPEYRRGARTLSTISAQHGIAIGRSHCAADDARALGLLFRALIRTA